jgi:cell wall-associated NlpC family hydrolase
MKRLLITGAVLGILMSMTGCVTPKAAAAEPIQINKALDIRSTTAEDPLAFADSAKRIPSTNLVDSIVESERKQGIVDTLYNNTVMISQAVAKLKARAGKTWYVFSGATPGGWDCSGLVMWMYEQVGVTLEHRASLQAKAGTVVTEPVIGDIVAYFYPGSKSAFHVGIYIGDGQVIHAPRPGTSTRIESATNGEFNHYGVTVKFIRIVPQLVDGKVTL